MRRTRLRKPSALPIEQYEVLAPKKTVLLCPFCCECVAEDWTELPERCPLCGQKLEGRRK